MFPHVGRPALTPCARLQRPQVQSCRVIKIQGLGIYESYIRLKDFKCPAYCTVQDLATLNNKIQFHINGGLNTHVVLSIALDDKHSIQSTQPFLRFLFFLISQPATWARLSIHSAKTQHHHKCQCRRDLHLTKLRRSLPLTQILWQSA